MVLLEYKNVSKKFGKKEALKDINLEISSGKIIGLFGKNGAGKTTMIKLANNLLIPSSGQILFKGEKLGIISKNSISYLPDKNYLEENNKVYQIYNFFADFYSNFDIEKALLLSKKLEIDIDKQISKLSKGMIEKIRLVLVLSRDTELYILDEPFEGIDPLTRDYILDIIKNLKKKSSIIICTHLINEVERILDEVVFLDDGKIVFKDNVKNIKGVDILFKEMFKC
ncbi:MAG: ABC transporter ATP-binding protein [Bacilli bacterium]|nr:ABC transporter ATP-binding protein [Bacilli bacterium]